MIEPANADKIREWLLSRGGVAVWVCRDLSSNNIGKETLTPAMTDGKPTVSPHWSNGNSPDRIVTNAAEIGVQSWREISRVKVRAGGPWNGGVHRADKDKLERAMSAAGDGASYTFDYDRPYGSPWFTAIISVPSKATALA